MPGSTGQETPAVADPGPPSRDHGGPSVPAPTPDVLAQGPKTHAAAPVALRGPGDLAEALPYLLGFHPDDSIVMIGMHGPQGRLGARLRVGIPQDPVDWPAVAVQAADHLINGAGPHRRPDTVAVFLCQDPREDEAPARTMTRLLPLAQTLRTACGDLEVPVVEAVCLSAGRWWSYTCPTASCCPPDGTPLNRSGTSVIAAAAVYAGIQVRGSLREMEARLDPVALPRAAAQQQALDDASAELLPRMLVDGDSESVQDETMVLAAAALERFRAAPPAPADLSYDAHDDGLLGDDEAAAIILGLQDRDTRDRAAEWMEGADAGPAERLWRALARRCVGVYVDHAAAPLTLAGWVAWSTGDEPAARVAFGRALNADPHYTFANLLSQACNHGLDPEPLRRCLRQERRKRLTRTAGGRERASGATGPKGRPDRGSSPAGAGDRPAGRARVRRRARSGEAGPPC